MLQQHTNPQMVLDAINSFYENYNANIYRGIYSSAETATQLYEDARTIIAQFIGAQRDEIIFTAGTTAGINFVAQTWGFLTLKRVMKFSLRNLSIMQIFCPGKGWHKLPEQDCFGIRCNQMEPWIWAYYPISNP